MDCFFSKWALNLISVSGSPTFGVTILLGALGLLYHLARNHRKVPKIVVSLAPGEASDDGIEGPPIDDMPLSIPEEKGYLQCYDPATKQRIGRVCAMTAHDVNRVVKKARVAQKAWSLTTFKERRRVLQCMQEYILRHMDDICRVCARDSGKPKLDAMLGEVLTTCEKIRCISSLGEGWLKRQIRPNGPLMVHKRSYVEYHPLGVLGVIAPWNYPFHNVYNHIISGIFAGNAVVTKVSEHTSWSSRYFGDIARKALSACGHSPDLCAIVTGFGEVGAALVACDGVDKIIFTGSPAVGKKVMAGAAPSAKPVILELGGKDPMIICDDANVQEVLPMAMRGVFQNCGQNCCGIERIYVYESQYDSFLQAATEAVKKLRQGPPLCDNQVDCGAMVIPAQLAIIQRLVDDAVKKGAWLVTGGKSNVTFPNGLFYEPTILANVTPEMLISEEEVFGPVMCVIKVPNNSDDAAVKAVNASRFGLGSSVFSASKARGIAIGKRLRCGMTTINDFGTMYLVQSLPFGGINESGFGRFAGPEGLRACCLEKSVVEDIVPFVKTTIPGILQYPIKCSSLSFSMAMVRIVYGPSLLDRVKGVFRLLMISLRKV